jgi:hypothetical protein
VHAKKLFPLSLPALHVSSSCRQQLKLVAIVYQLHSHQVLDQHGWTCASCGRSQPLQIHRRKFRSHGGTNRPENLEPVYWVATVGYMPVREGLEMFSGLPFHAIPPVFQEP